MALLTKAEFASLCGVQTNYLSVAINRGNVVLSGEMVDTDGEHNRLFLERRRKGPRDVEPKVKKPKRLKPVKPQKKVAVKPEPVYTEDDSEPVEIDDSDIPTLLDSERKLKFLDTQKREKEVEKLDLDIQKKRGEVIPAALVLPVLTRQNMSMVTAFKNACDTILTKYTKIRDLNVNEIADIRGFFLEAINEGSDKAAIETEKAITNIINDYSDKRGVGERL